MKVKLLIPVLMCSLNLISYGQQNTIWKNWDWIMGSWKGEGDGEPGQGSGTFTFSSDLNKKIIIRKGHTEFPATENKPAVSYDDYMIVYLIYVGTSSKAIYFDSEGHTINYSISYSDKSIVLTSEKTSKNPVFRLTYSLLEDEKINTKFETSQDGEKFTTHIEGKSSKIKSPPK